MTLRNPETAAEESRRGRVGVALVALGVVGALIAGVSLRNEIRQAWRWNTWSLRPSISVATGPEGSPHHLLGRRLGPLIEDRFPGLEVGVLETVGSATNAELLEAGQAELGFIPNRPPRFPYPSLRTVAKLYEEVLQIVVRPDRGISDVTDLAGKQIDLGPCDSATRELVLGVLTHYSLTVRGWPDCSLAARLDTSQHAWPELDAAAFLAGLPLPDVQERLEEPGVDLLALGEAGQEGASLEGLSLALRGVRPSRVPARAYGRLPAEPVGTLGIETLLVARDDAPEGFVEEVTKVLFDNRFLLSEEHSAMEQMEELPVGARLRFPVHPGARAFYARNQPHPLVQWAEPMSLGLALVVSLGSGLLALRQWFRRTKKDRIDTFYVELERISEEIAAAGSADEIESLEARLHRLRKRAFRELVAERLQADESFSIFQTSLSHRLMEISHRLANGLPRAGGP